MEQFMLQLGSMSMQAVMVILVVLLVRVVFAGARVPKKYVNWLWLVPYIIMICPWKINSVLSFWRMPKDYQADRVQAETESVQQTVVQMFSQAMSGKILSDSEAMGNVSQSTVQGNRAEVFTGQVGSGIVEGGWTLSDILGLLWLLGVIILIVYSVVSYIRLQEKVLCSMRVEGNIYRADDVSTAFVLGVVRPKIYLPSGMNEENMLYVLEHEKTHIRRLDPLKKILAFGITAVHWFNPLAWVAFYFFCKDMEMACDEETVARIGIEKKQSYAMALLQLSSSKRGMVGVPLAFGEDNVKDRVRNIVKLRKVWVFVSVVAVIVVIVLAVGFLTKYDDTTTLDELKEEVGIIRWSENAEPIWVTIDEKRMFFSEAYYEDFVEFFNQLEVTKEPISPSRADDRPKDVTLRVGTSHFNIYNGTYIYIGNDYKEIWFNDGMKPSLSYGIINPQELKDFIELQENSVVQAEVQEGDVAPEPEATPEGDAEDESATPGSAEEVVTENGDERSEIIPWADLDGDGTEEYILLERGDFGGANTVNGRITMYVNNEPVYQYTEELWIVSVAEKEYIDLDGDGQEEIFVCFGPAVNSMPLVEWFVLKKNADGWEMLEMYHYKDDMSDNAFPITVVLDKKDFQLVIQCEGWEGEIPFDATQHYERRKAELEEGNSAYTAFVEGPYVEGSVVGSPMSWGVWYMQAGTYNGEKCLIAEHGLGGPWGKYDYYGNADVYFNYDADGKINILHMEFTPTDF